MSFLLSSSCSQQRMNAISEGYLLKLTAFLRCWLRCALIKLVISSPVGRASQFSIIMFRIILLNKNQKQFFLESSYILLHCLALNSSLSFAKIRLTTDVQQAYSNYSHQMAHPFSQQIFLSYRITFLLALPITIQIIQMIKSFSATLLKMVVQPFSQVQRQPFMKITSTAVGRLKDIMRQKKDNSLIGVKISLSKKGCSGLGYNMDYIRQEQIKKFDEVIESQGIKVVVDNKAIMALIGTQMNFVEDELGSQFVFNNPNEKGKCGCGESFYI